MFVIGTGQRLKKKINFLKILQQIFSSRVCATASSNCISVILQMKFYRLVN